MWSDQMKKWWRKYEISWRRKEIESNQCIIENENEEAEEVNETINEMACHEMKEEEGSMKKTYEIMSEYQAKKERSNNERNEMKDGEEMNNNEVIININKRHKRNGINLIYACKKENNESAWAKKRVKANERKKKIYEKSNVNNIKWRK